MSNLNVNLSPPETANAISGPASQRDAPAPAHAEEGCPVGLQCATDKRGGLIVVAAVGDVDLASAGMLGGELSAQLVPASAVVLECTGITFMDSMGLQVLLRTHRYAAEQSAFFGLIGANEYVDRVLELSGLTDVLPRFADIETAQAQLAPPTIRPSSLVTRQTGGPSPPAPTKMLRRRWGRPALGSRRILPSL